MLSQHTDADTVLALSVFVKLMRAAETVSAQVHRELTGEGITVSQLGVLEALLHLGPLCQRDLAAKILKSTGNLTLVLDNLEKRGLVERSRDQRDRRYFTVSLTESGRRLIERIFPAHAERIRQRMAALEQDELAELGRLLKKLGYAQAERSDI